MERFVQLPQTQKRFQADGAEAEFRGPEAMRKIIPAELARWAKVAKDANIQVQ
jgi:tripartite-type tricarboxylate transporter receptor subunit TctC